ncbi:MAG: hypothetical protein JNK85_06390 [Verrucomicrobiales bacterium]|nr:hypothetical protein [Verrucomicrobiales bacterium]
MTRRKLAERPPFPIPIKPVPALILAVHRHAAEQRKWRRLATVILTTPSVSR